MPALKRRAAASAFTASLCLAAMAAGTVGANADPGAGFTHSTRCSGTTCQVGAYFRVPAPGPGRSGGSSAAGPGRPVGATASELPCVSREVLDGASVLVVPAAGLEGRECAHGGDSGQAADPRAAAESVRSSLELPELVLGGAPPPGADKVVRVPVWLWVDPEAWEPVSASAAVSVGSVTVTATPVSVEWETGDGGEVVCPGPGTPFDPERHRGGTPSPDCGHVYSSASADSPGGVFTVTARARWEVRWEATGSGGGELAPLFTEAEASARVVEVHSLVTRG